MKESEFNNIYDNFNKKFPIENLEKMKLEEYTNLSKDSFCYWVETETRLLGNIKGSTSYKFGIYKFNQPPREDSGYLHDEKYAWVSKYGDNAQDVFYKNILPKIIKIATCSRNEEFDKIDEIDISEMFKWKIAFLYSEKELVNWFSRDALLEFARHFGYNTDNKTSTSKLQEILIKERGFKTASEFDLVLQPIWDKIKEHTGTKMNRSYYVVSPNVWNDNDFDYLLDYMKENHCVLMGWGEDNAKGKLFADLKTEDCIVVALRRNWEFRYYFIGTVSPDFVEKNEQYNGAQQRRLDNFISLEDKNVDFLKNWSQSGSSQIPAIARIDKNKNPEIIEIIESLLNGASNMSSSSLLDDLAEQLKHSRNLILHGAPGTGKTYLAKQIAEKMGAETDFVQFHPSYDYTDFVEGLRPVQNEAAGQIGFERKDGVFKEFCERALENLIDSQKSTEDLEKEKSLNEKIENFLENAIEKKSEFKTVTGNQFFITDNTEKSISVPIPENEKTSELSLPKSDLIELLSSENEIKSGGDIKSFFNRKWRTQQDSYIWILYEKIQSLKQEMTISNVEEVQEKPFIFIIDEINRGELSKIFGELFYAIDPGYRVSFEDLKKHRSGEKKIHTIRTQYANLETFGNEFDKALRANDYGHFFVPENVYIIGTMNDIDRSVDSMDFAFRRRFAFKEITADATQSMLDEKTDENGNKSGLLQEIADEAKKRMSRLNDAISKICGLPSSYHIGGAYFLKLKEFEGDIETKFKNLWEYHLSGLLREYLRGSENEKENIASLKNAYFKTETENVFSEPEE